MSSRILPLQLQDLRYRVGDLDLLGPINLTLEAKLKTLVIGPNGAGKSLMLKLCHGLLKPSSGQIKWMGSDKQAADRHQSFVFQHPIMLRRTSLENVAYPLKIRGLPQDERNERAIEVLKMTGISHLADRPALKLSGGEKQKLSLARSWATRPEVLFLDEPTANLDPRSTHDMENLINQIYQTGTKIIMTTHDMPQVRRLADEICFIHQGKIIEHGPVNKLLESPENPMTAAFVNGELLI